MSRKALLIGAQTAGLTGVDNDVKAMAAVLAQWGFETVRCQAENASRAGILDAYARLIAEARPDDAIFIFYSGHGGFYQQPDYDTAVRPRAAMQFIVPADYHESTEGDFRGITSFELSQLQSELTRKTRNVTVAMDCCHAAHMSRDPAIRVRSLSRSAPYAVIASHLESLERRGQSFAGWRSLGNVDAVRLVACAPDQSAYECANEAGETMGAFTDALTRLLSEAAAANMTWETVLDSVRQRVLTVLPQQRPEVEGPARRLIFDVRQADPVISLPVTDIGGGRMRLDGARLLGVNVGDELFLMPADSVGPDTATKLAALRVDKVDSVNAFGNAELTPPLTVLPPDARAHRVKAADAPLAVRIPADQPWSADLARAVAEGRLLRPAEAGEPTTLEVRAESDGLVVCDEIGPLHTTPRPADRSGIVKVVQDLHRLARATKLRRLAEDPGHELTAALTVEFGLVEGGAERPLSSSGEVLHLGQRVFVRVRNDGDERVHVSLLNIGVAGQVSLLTNISASGVRLDAGKEYVLGWNEFSGVLEGIPLHWPQAAPPPVPRPETILVLATSVPQDLRVLEQGGVRRATGPRSSLEQLLDQAMCGGSRDMTVDGGHGVRYAVRTVHFELVPQQQPVEETKFQVDEQPDPTVRLFTRRGAGPATVALRLSDLVVHSNRALRSADIRLDAVVLTVGADGMPAYQAQTERFPGIRDGQRLPMDKMLVFHGRAVDYLDVAVWVTRDSRESLDLSDLMRDKLTDPQVQGALAQLGGLVVAAPQAAVAVAAAGASAIIVNVAYQLLRKTVGDSIGLYRTTLLANEGFGVGRTAEQNTVRAQDFSFSYLVEDVA